VVSGERMSKVLCCFGEVGFGGQTSSGKIKLGSDPVTGVQRHCDDDLCRAEVELFSAWARHEQCGLRINLFLLCISREAFPNHMVPERETER